MDVYPSWAMEGPFDLSSLLNGKEPVMAIVSEMPKVKEVQSMSLAQIRQQLDEFHWQGRVDPSQRAQLQAKLREIMIRLAKISRRGGQFAQVEPSRQLMELYKHSRWA